MLPNLKVTAITDQLKRQMLPHLKLNYWKNWPIKKSDVDKFKSYVKNWPIKEADVAKLKGLWKNWPIKKADVAKFKG